MSFGFSIGDFIMLGELAGNVYRKYRDAPKSFSPFTRDARGLHNALEDIRDLVTRKTVPQHKVQQLSLHAQECRETLEEMDQLINKYLNSSVNNKALFARFQWDQDRADGLRARLVSNVTLLNTFYASVIASSTFNIERAVDYLVQDLQTRSKSLDTVSSFVAKEGSDSEWASVRGDLETLGIDPTDANDHRQLIAQRIRQSVITMKVESVRDNANAFADLPTLTIYTPDLQSIYAAAKAGSHDVLRTLVFRNSLTIFPSSRLARASPEVQTATKTLLSGRWSGKYDYSLCRKGVAEGTCLDIYFPTPAGDQTTDSERFYFESKGEDQAGAFIVLGKMLSGTVIAWAKIYPTIGNHWIYFGSWDRNSNTITGFWGPNSNTKRGRFELYKQMSRVSHEAMLDS